VEDRIVVLVVEDEDNSQESYKIGLERHGIEVLQAFTIDDAWAHFSARQDKINIIVMDACMPYELDTVPLLRRIRDKGYAGPIVANSSAYNQELSMAGCSHESKKWQTVKTVLGILKISG